MFALVVEGCDLQKVRVCRLLVLEKKRPKRTEVVFVAVSPAGEPLASGAFCFSEGRVRRMACDPAWQGRGLGSLIYNHVENEARKQGCSKLTLECPKPRVSWYRSSN